MQIFPDSFRAYTEAVFHIWEISSRFFVNKVDYAMCSEYSICYEKIDGSIIEIVELGITEQPLIMIDHRIFYATRTDIVSVNFEGKDQISFHENTNNDYSDFEFDTILYHKDGYLYCKGIKSVVDSDGYHTIPVQMKINAELTALEEIE